MWASPANKIALTGLISLPSFHPREATNSFFSAIDPAKRVPNTALLFLKLYVKRKSNNNQLQTNESDH